MITCSRLKISRYFGSICTSRRELKTAAMFSQILDFHNVAYLGHGV